MTSPGFWNSPISAEDLVKDAIRFGNIQFDNNDLYFSEGRPSEKGRSVIVKYDGNLTDMTPENYSSRTRVHEYGGLSFTVNDSVICFSNDSDQQIYKQSDSIEPISQDGVRYAEPVHTRTGLILIAEKAGEGETQNYIDFIHFDTEETICLLNGADFYSSVTVNPAQTKIAWLQWNHPSMPWNVTELWMADFDTGTLSNAKLIAGGDTSIYQPQFINDDTLVYVSDINNWWNFYSYNSGNEEIEQLTDLEAEFALPQWVFGMSTWGFNENEIIATCSQDSIWKLYRISLNTKSIKEIDLGFVVYDQIRVAGNKVAFFAETTCSASALYLYDLDTDELKRIKESVSVTLENTYISKAEIIEFESADHRHAYAYYYPPVNPDYDTDAMVPLIVNSHGGPTAQSSCGFSLKTQFWTSRGFAVIDVNYGGSTGYGRDYRNSLNKQWGIVDVEDCIAAAQYLVEKGLVDPNKMAISGGSAGGFTTLAALTFHDVFSVGVSYYGVSDLIALAEDTHKFEARYLDGLIGEYPLDKKLYIERSPINHVDKLNCPVLFLQGLKDAVVPPNQAEMMLDALQKKGVECKYVSYEEEGHGFRQAENIIDAINHELAFYQNVFS